MHPFYGVRRLALHLHWSENKIRRIRNLSGIRIPRAGKRYKYKRSGVVYKNKARLQDGMSYAGMTGAEAWAQDFTYIWFEQSFCYLAVVLGLKTRQVVGWRLGVLATALS